MAPRAPEGRKELLKRLQKSFAQGALEVRFGRHHFSHAVCREGARWCVRRLEVTDAEREAYLAEHGHYMPESEEAIAKPRTLLFEADSLAQVIARLDEVPI